MRVAQSSHIMGHEYDIRTQTLIIQFHNGATYAYSGISPSEYSNFSQSSSPGTYFWSHIRDRHQGTLIAPGDERSS